MDDRPAWSTLTALSHGVPTSSARLPLLRELRHLSNAHIVQLAKRKEPLDVEALAWHGPEPFEMKGGFSGSGLVAIAAFERIACLPRRRLALHGDTQMATYPQAEGIEMKALAWALKPPGLEELAFPNILARLPEIIDAVNLTKLGRVVIYSAGGPHQICGSDSILTRDPGGDFSCLEMRYTGDRHNLRREVDWLEGLPPGLLTALQLKINAGTWKSFNEKKRFNAALKRQKRLKKGGVVAG